MKTFNYESNCVRYKNCFFDVVEQEKDKLSLSIYGYVENDKNVSHIANATVSVSEKLKKDEVVIDTYANSNLISFLLELGVIKCIVRRITVNNLRLPIVKLDINRLYEYSFNQEVLKIAS